MGTSGAVLVEGFQYMPVIDLTCSNATALSKGMLLGLDDPRTASGAGLQTGNRVFGGIATADKEASDGITNISTYQYGIFDIENQGGTINVGDNVVMSGAYAISGAPLQAGGNYVGKALETGSTGEVIEVFVGA